VPHIPSAENATRLSNYVMASRAPRFVDDQNPVRVQPNHTLRRSRSPLSSMA